MYIEVFYKQFAHADFNVYFDDIYEAKEKWEKPDTATNDNAVFGNADGKTLPSYFCMHMQILRNRHNRTFIFFNI